LALSPGHGGGADDSLAAAFYSALQIFGLHASHLQATNRWVEFGRWSGVLTLLATIWFVLWKKDFAGRFSSSAGSFGPAIRLATDA